MSTHKILMIGPRFDCRGGISTVAKMLYDHLRSKGYLISYLASTIEGVFIKRFLYTLLNYFKFLIIILSKRLSLIHIHCSTDRSFYRKMYYIIFSQLIKRKVVLHVHPGRFYDFYESHSKCLKIIIKKMLTKSDAIIVLFEGIKKKFSEMLPAEKIFVLNNPIISRDFRCQKKKKNKVVLFLGWIIPEKGVYDILEVIPEVVEKEPSVKFVFRGPKEFKKLKLVCEKANFRDHVSVNGWVDEKEKTELLSQSTMLILPSYTEGFPNVILEAMASCLPIIATQVGAIPEILQEGINGFLVPPGDIVTMKEKIFQILKDPGYFSRMGEINQKLVREKYDIKVIGKRLEEIYLQISQ